LTLQAFAPYQPLTMGLLSLKPSLYCQSSDDS
jgi:hypothetical protein